MKNLVQSASICAFLLIASSFNIGCVLYKVTNDDQKIIGTWISEKDKNWKMVFISNRCSWYYSDSLTHTNSYIISNSTPQCCDTIPVTAHTSYLKLVNLADTSDVICYEIHGISAETLSLSAVGMGGQLVFTRQ